MLKHITSHLGNGLRAVALRYLSVVKSPRLHLSSHRRPGICCCQWEASLHRLSAHGKNARRKQQAWPSRSGTDFLSETWKTCFSHSCGSISSLRTGVQSSAQAQTSPAQAPWPQAQADLNTKQLDKYPASVLSKASNHFSKPSNSDKGLSLN